MASSPAEVLNGQNPWWRDGVVPEARPYRRALVRAALGSLRADHPRRFQVLLGPRRVGKTVAMYQMADDLLRAGVPPRSVVWIRLDHPMLMSADLGSLVREAIAAGPGSGETFLFLDEIVYADRWDLWLKTMYDERWPVRAVATASATAAMRHARRESGVGRWQEHFLPPLLFHEFLAVQGRPVAVAAAAGKDALDLLEAPAATEPPLGHAELSRALQAYLLVGGFPELAATLAPDVESVLRSQRVLKDDAVDRALYKDLTQAYRIEEPMALERLLYILAGQVGGLLSTRSACQSAGVSLPTAERYVKYLEEASLVLLVPSFAPAEESVQRRGRKIYLGDAALRTAILQRGLLPLEDPAEIGILLENAVAVHLNALARAHQLRLYHWRQGTREVDFVLDHPDRPIAVEVTWGRRHDASSLRALVEAEPRLAGRVWLVGPGQPDLTPAQAEDGVGRVSPERWMLACGMAWERAVAGNASARS